MRKLLLGLIVLSCVQACKQSIEYKTLLHDPALFSRTVYELNTVVMGNNFPPMVASRNYVYAAVAAYEVVAAAYPNEYKSLGGQLKGLQKPVAPTITADMDIELATLLAYMKVGESVTFPEGSMKDYEDSILQVAREKGLSSKIEKASRMLADSISIHIIRWSKKDNYLQTRGAEKYAVKKIPGRWVPTPPMYATAVEPHWHEIRPMVIDSASVFDSPPPPVFNMSDKKIA